MKKLINFAAFLVAFVAVFVTIMYLTAPTQTTQEPVQKTEAVKIVKPIDLAGKWESVESKAGTKFVGEVKDNRVYIQMYVSDGYTGLWYGSFDILQPGQNTINSKAIEDDDHFVLSSSETKEFLYQKGSLIFSFSVMGTTTTIEMKRV